MVSLSARLGDNLRCLLTQTVCQQWPGLPLGLFGEGRSPLPSVHLQVLRSCTAHRLGFEGAATNVSGTCAYIFRRTVSQ